VRTDLRYHLYEAHYAVAAAGEPFKRFESLIQRFGEFLYELSVVRLSPWPVPSRYPSTQDRRRSRTLL
jgi:hypothetical protein